MYLLNANFWLHLNGEQRKEQNIFSNMSIMIQTKIIRCQKVSTNFDLKELSKLKVTKASGPDGITARLLKDAAPVIAKPRLTWLTLLFQQDLFQLSGRMQE